MAEKMIYCVIAKNPLDMEGSDYLIAACCAKGTAEDAVDKLNELEETIARKQWGERWESFAVSFYIKEQPLDDSAENIVQSYMKDVADL